MPVQDVNADIKHWGFSEVLGPVLRRNFRGTEEQAIAIAQRFANERVVDVDYWDESDKSAKPGVRAVSLRTINPLPELQAEKQRQRAEERREATRRTWRQD